LIRLENEHSEIHEAMRREIVASAALKHWQEQYRLNPTDANALAFHLAWVMLREAVDALVKIPSPIRELVALAVATPERTE
jgi:hypothetical protein